jgi:hypothetical protein
MEKYINQLKELKTYHEKSLEHVKRLLDIYGEPEQDPNLSDTERAKQGLTHIHDKAYRITELMHFLEMEGLEVNRSIVHNALKQLRINGEIVAFKLNGSNQQVYYMSKEGIGEGEYPVKQSYRPIQQQYVTEFEWLELSS